MTAKYAADGQVCEMVLEVRHYHSRKEIDLDNVSPGKLETSLIDELVPKSERGEPSNRWSKREPKDAWVDPDSYMAGGVSYIKRSYENVIIEQHGYYRCHSDSFSKEKDKADCREGGDEVIVIRWTKRACAAGKSSELTKAVPWAHFAPLLSNPAGAIPDDLEAVKRAEAVFSPIFGPEEVTKFLPYPAQLRDGIWTVYGTVKPSQNPQLPKPENKNPTPEKKKDSSS
jgi:hypothetical protein